jgi:hypothetical protein
MGKGREREKDIDKARLAKEAADRDRENREKRLNARAVSQSLQHGLSGAAAAAATAAALMDPKGGKGAKSAASPPRNSTNEDRESVDAESPMRSKKRRNVRPADQSPPDSEEDGTDKSAPASESENEEITTGSKITASNKLKQRAGIQVDSIAARKSPTRSATPVAADKSASASQVYHHDASVDFTI